MPGWPDGKFRDYLRLRGVSSSPKGFPGCIPPAGVVQTYVGREARAISSLAVLGLDAGSEGFGLEPRDAGEVTNVARNYGQPVS